MASVHQKHRIWIQNQQHRLLAAEFRTTQMCPQIACVGGCTACCRIWKQQHFRSNWKKDIGFICELNRMELCKALNIDFIFCKNLLHYWINICKPKSYDKCFFSPAIASENKCTFEFQIMCVRHLQANFWGIDCEDKTGAQGLRGCKRKIGIWIFKPSKRQTTLFLTFLEEAARSLHWYFSGYINIFIFYIL